MIQGKNNDLSIPRNTAKIREQFKKKNTNNTVALTDYDWLCVDIIAMSAEIALKKRKKTTCNHLCITIK
jgi:hypothetical protein